MRIQVDSRIDGREAATYAASGGIGVPVVDSVWLRGVGEAVTEYAEDRTRAVIRQGRRRYLTGSRYALRQAVGRRLRRTAARQAWRRGGRKLARRGAAAALRQARRVGAREAARVAVMAGSHAAGLAAGPVGTAASVVYWHGVPLARAALAPPWRWEYEVDVLAGRVRIEFTGDAKLLDAVTTQSERARLAAAVSGKMRRYVRAHSGDAVRLDRGAV